MSFLAVLLSAGILTRMTESAEDIFKQWQRGHLPPVEPVVPVPVEATLGVPLPVGLGYLQRLFRRFLCRVSPSDRSHPMNYCLHDLCVLWVGTVCSGTDGPLLCWRAFADTLRADLGESVVVSH